MVGVPNTRIYCLAVCKALANPAQDSNSHKCTAPSGHVSGPRRPGHQKQMITSSQGQPPPPYLPADIYHYLPQGHDWDKLEKVLQNSAGPL